MPTYKKIGFGIVPVLLWDSIGMGLKFLNWSDDRKIYNRMCRDVNYVLHFILYSVNVRLLEKILLTFYRRYTIPSFFK